MNNAIEKQNNCYSLFTVFLLLFPFMNVYSIPSAGLGIGEVVMTVVMISILIMSGFKIRTKVNNSLLLLFFAYSVFITFFTVLLYPSIEVLETVKRVLRDGFYIFIIWGFAKYYFDYKIGFRVLNNIAMALSVYILLQFIAYLAFKIYVPGFISGLSIDAGTAELYKQKALNDAVILGYLRPNGFLSEPAQCAHFLSLTILINLFSSGEKSQNKIKHLTLYTLAIICSTSLNGIILLLAAYGIYFLQMIKTTNKKRFINTIAVIIAFMVCIGVTYFKVPYIQNIVSRLDNIMTTTSGSAAMRTMRGLVFFSKMPLIDKITGIGFGNFIGYRQDTGIWTVYEEAVEYFNTDAYLLISTGIAGCIILVLAIIRFIKKGDRLTFAVFVLLFIMGLSSSIYSTPIMTIALSFALFRKTLNKNDSSF